MSTFHITREQVSAVLGHRYSQEDWERGKGPVNSYYNIQNNHPSFKEAFENTALVMEAMERQKRGIFEVIDLGALIKHLG